MICKIMKKFHFEKNKYFKLLYILVLLFFKIEEKNEIIYNLFK